MSHASLFEDMVTHSSATEIIIFRSTVFKRSIAAEQ